MLYDLHLELGVAHDSTMHDRESTYDNCDRVRLRRRIPDRILLYTDDGDAAAAAVHERGITPVSVLVRRSSLEDVFLRLTGRSLIE